MGNLWMILTNLHSLAGPGVTLLYPLYESIQAMENQSELDGEQWLAYWILYSFITLLEMILESIIYWIPIWYELKLLFMAWLVLPKFRGAAFIYDRLVREHLKEHGLLPTNTCRISILDCDHENMVPSTSAKGKRTKVMTKFRSFLTSKKLRFRSMRF